MEFAAGIPHDLGKACAEPAQPSRPCAAGRLNPPFRVAALVAPTLAPAWLARYSWGSMTTGGGFDDAWAYTDGIHEISLFFGRMDAPSGPAVTVATTILDDKSHQLRSLECELTSERHRLADHPSCPIGDAPGSAAHPSGSLLLGGALVCVDLCFQGELWAARAETQPSVKCNRLVVTVVARGVPFDRVTLDWVDDLRPFVAERRRMIDVIRNERQPPGR